ncbi:MAG: VRR-NUC domain-containing protein [Roseburia sp.]|nr:VRR-NUC domain-containing protein [Roseburia sp.]
MNEKQIEKKLTAAAKKNGGIALKLVCPSFAGMPDRLILLPDGHIGFVELKSLGKKPRRLQISRHRLLRRLGFKVYVLDVESEIGGIIDDIRST